MGGFQINAECFQYTTGSTFFVAHHTQQQMFGSNVGVIEVFGITGGFGQCYLNFRSIRNLRRLLWFASSAGQLLYFFSGKF